MSASFPDQGTISTPKHSGASVVVQLDQTNQRQEKMMASDDEKIKTNSAAEHEAPPENKSTSSAEASKADGGETAAASPPGYSRGEGQKPVSKAYRENWNVIFALDQNGCTD